MDAFCVPVDPSPKIVESLNRFSFTADEPKTFEVITVANTKILLEALDGVMLTDKPETSAKVVLVVLAMSFFVA